jgi:hypothetical protein
MDPFTIILQPIWPLYSILRAVLILTDVALFFLAIFAAVELFSYRPKFSPDPVRQALRHKTPGLSPQETAKIAWQNIRAKAEQGTNESLRVAVIEADGFVDSVLKKRGLEGETFADRLQKLNRREYATLDRVWDAHRVRNDIVHTPDFEASPDTVRIALDNYEAFLRELGAI